MSKVDAQRALAIYKTFARQTDAVVQYLSTARQYQTYTRLEVPKLKHAPTTLGSSLEDYLNDPDFEVNRRQYMAEQEAKRTGRPMPAPASQASAVSKPAAAITTTATTTRQPQTTLPPKNVGADLIDFFESIEPNGQPIQQSYPQQQQVDPNFAQAQLYQQAQQAQIAQQQSGFNPFGQNFGQQPQAPQQPQPLQTDFTGAGFGGYGPQPQQQQQQQQQPMMYGFNSAVSPISSDGFTGLSSQPTGTNPFRQSMMATGGSTGPVSPLSTTINRQSTNPFAKHNTAFQNQSIPEDSVASPTKDPNIQQQQSFQSQTFSPVQQPLQAQRTGTNPFAKSSLSPPPASALPVNVTGSTNPFRQSQFVNQQTGQGWQHSQQGTFGGFDINGVQTTSIFPRPGAQQQQQ